MYMGKIIKPLDKKFNDNSDIISRINTFNLQHF